MKAHCRGIQLAADLEMHLGRRGYVGLCQVEDGQVNVCGLFREPSKAMADGGDLVEQFSDGIGHGIRDRLTAAEWVEDSVCAVGGLPINQGRRSREELEAECAIGDAVAMVPPLTGNGMSMALESAWLASGPLIEFAGGSLGWAECRARIAHRHTSSFGSRLRRSTWLHRLWTGATAPSRWGRLVMGLVDQSDWAWRLAVAATR